MTDEQCIAYIMKVKQVDRETAERMLYDIGVLCYLFLKTEC